MASAAKFFAILLAVWLPAQTPAPEPPAALPARTSPLQPAIQLLSDGKTAEARTELTRLQKSGLDSADLWYQMARSHLLDFYREENPAKKRIALSLAMESLGSALKRDENHIPSLRAKSVLHARAELLYYDPNLAYQLAERVVRQEPNANGFLLNLSEWMSGEVRFTRESGHRVPHDPLIGLDRSVDLLDRVIDNGMPFSNEEIAALFGMAKTLARRGNFNESIRYFRQTLQRPISADQRAEVLREMGAAYYRMADFNEAARTFYELLQFRPNLVDQWLLRVALDQLGSAAPPLPKQVLFPTAPKPDTSRWNLEFKDVAPELGVNRFDGNGTCSWADFDSDGDLDLFLSGSQTFLSVYRNDGGKFNEATAATGLVKVPSAYSMNLVDFDNDGDPDLYLCYNGWNGPMPNRLYRNSGGKFEDISSQSGAADTGDGFVSLWADFDNDGWTDLAIANGVLKDGSVLQVYRNNREGAFVNMTRQAGLQEPPTHGAIGMALGDYDRDGDVDILMNGLEPAPNRLYRNDGNWKFTEVSRQVGLLQPVHNGFVCFFFDYNNDAYPDILTTSLAAWEAVVDGLRAGYAPADKRAMHPDASRLFRNNRDGTFSDVTFEAGLFHPMGVMGGGVADLDNDGFLDIYFGTGDPQLSRLEPNRLFRNNGEGAFTDATAVVGFARPGNKGHGVSFLDFDGDGDLEVYAQLGGHYPGDMAYNAFYRNLKGQRAHWLEIDLKATRSNRDAIGAQVTVKAGDWLAYREVKGSEGFGATNPYRVHFGLGARDQLDSLEVRWPSGQVNRLSGVKTNQVLQIREP
jgi:tetratricopeptide (TPR) repeat protein